MIYIIYTMIIFQGLWVKPRGFECPREAAYSEYDILGRFPELLRGDIFMYAPPPKKTSPNLSPDGTPSEMCGSSGGTGGRPGGTRGRRGRALGPGLGLGQGPPGPAPREGREGRLSSEPRAVGPGKGETDATGATVFLDSSMLVRIRSNLRSRPRDQPSGPG